MAIRQLTRRFSSTTVSSPVRRRVGLAADADALSIDALKHLGITRIRFTLYWNNYLDARLFAADRTTVVTSGGKTVAQYFADDVAAFLAAGIDPLIVVHSPPAGMTLAQGIVAMPTFMAARAAQFPGRTWEILNEMNGDDVFNGAWFEASNGAVSDSTRGDRYGQLIGPVYTAIKAADATATVVTGGIDRGLTAFYAALLARAPGKFDAFCVHAYGPPVLPAFLDKSQTLRPVIGSMPLWCTEFGNQSTDDDVQAADLGLCLDDNDRNNRYERIYLYRLIGDGGFGVVNGDGSWRHAALLLPDRTAS